jgi:hypothetical protein
MYVLQEVQDFSDHSTVRVSFRPLRIEQGTQMLLCITVA